MLDGEALIVMSYVLLGEHKADFYEFRVKRIIIHNCHLATCHLYYNT